MIEKLIFDAKEVEADARRSEIQAQARYEALVADTSDLGQRVRACPSPCKDQNGGGSRVSGRGLHASNCICPAPACNAIGRRGKGTPSLAGALAMG